MKTNKIHTIRAIKPIKPRGRLVTKHKAFGTAYSLENPNFMLVNEGGKINPIAQKKIARLSKNEARKIKQYMVSYKVQGKPLSYKEAQWAIHDPHTKLTIFLHNMGVSPEEVYSELISQGYEISADYVMEPKNWTFNKYASGDATLMLPDGKTAYFVFQYHGGFAIEVQGGTANA